MSPKIAVVGSGVSGIAAVWALKQTAHEVHLFEAQDRLGGHVESVEWKGDNNENIMVDIAFQMFNHVRYPNFSAFLSHMNIPSFPVKATFGLSRDNGQFEWSSTSLLALFVRWRNILSLELWRMIADIARFNLTAAKALDPNYPYKNESIGDFIHRNNYSKQFANDYLIPLVSSVWIHDPQETVDSLPMIMIIKHLRNHNLLSVNPYQSSVHWNMIYGGASRYVDAVVDGIPRERIHKSAPVTGIRDHEKGVVLALADGSTHYFDRVIFATPAPTTLQILGDFATETVKDVLGKFRVSNNSIILHSDTRLMPRSRAAWAAWNYHGSASGPLSLTCDLTCMMGITQKAPILTSMNPHHLPDPALTQGVFHYQHPIFDGEAIAAQNRVKSIQGVKNVWFAGAWLKYGFHEDGFTSGVKAALMACPEIKLPFQLTEWEDYETPTKKAKRYSAAFVAFFAFFVNSGLFMVSWVRQLYEVFCHPVEHRKWRKMA